MTLHDEVHNCQTFYVTYIKPTPKLGLYLQNSIITYTFWIQQPRGPGLRRIGPPYSNARRKGDWSGVWLRWRYRFDRCRGLGAGLAAICIRCELNRLSFIHGYLRQFYPSPLHNGTFCTGSIHFYNGAFIFVKFTIISWSLAICVIMLEKRWDSFKMAVDISQANLLVLSMTV